MIVLIVYENVPIAGLVKKIFREVYGVEDDELYRNAELRERIRSAVKNLRDSYKNPVCVTNYSDDEIRNAYMIAYYPYYIMPACFVVENFVAPFMSRHETVCLDFFASGPCPELLGTVLALKKYCSRVKVQTYDSEQGWLPYQRLTFNYADNILPTVAPAVLIKYATDLSKTDIFFLQNFLSHLPYQCVDIFLKKFSAKIQSARRETFFVFIDLNYGSTTAVFGKILDENFIAANNLKIIALSSEIYTVQHENTTPALLENIFTGEHGLKPKKNTKFYFLVLQKI